MKKLIKFTVITGLIMAILAIAGLVTLRLMFPPEKIKRITLEYAQNTLHREIKFDSISFNLIGFTLNNFAMSEENSFAQGTFIKADRVEAKAAFWPLLKKQIQISTVYIDGLDVYIQKNEDGSFNFDSLSGSDTPTEQPQPTATDKAAAGFVFTARFIKATDCDFYYKDLQTGTSSSLEDVNIQLGNVDFDKPFPINISFIGHTQDTTGLKISVPIDIALNLFLAGLDLPNAYVEISNATAQYKNMKLALQGKAENFNSPAVNLSGSLTGLDNTALKDLLPDLPNFTLPTVYMNLQAATDLDNSTATVSQATLKILDSSLSTQGNVNWGGENTTYNFSGNLQADIGQIVKMADDTGFDPKGTLSGTFTATDKKDGQDVSGTVTLKNISALYPPFTLTQTNGTIKLASLDDISCPSLTGLLNGEKFNASFAYKNIKDVLDLTLKLNLDKLALNEIPFSNSSDTTDTATTSETAAPKTATPQTYMNINADVAIGALSVPYFRTDGVSLQAALKNVSENMQKASGTVEFALQPGAITDMDKLVKQSKVARIILLPLTLLNKVGKKLNLNLFEAETQAKKGEIAMTKAAGHYTFTNGLMNIDQTVFESSLTNLNASGTANFATSELNIKASATLVTKQTPLIIKITGTMDNPSGKVDVLNTVTSVVGGILSYKTAKGAVTGTASTAGSVTKGAAQTATQAATTTIKDTAKAVKAIGSLFKKKSDSAQ